jgi:hypothetical protein
MLPDPLHPAVVHFTIVFMFLLPVAAFGALWAIRRGSRVLTVWAFPVVTAAALAGSAWASVETGEDVSDGAEKVVGEQRVEPHEDAAERFLALSTGVLVIMSAGFLRGNAGRAARTVGSVAALGLIIAGIQVGHSGGQIVYGDGTHPGLTGTAVQGGGVGGKAGGGEGGSAPGDSVPAKKDRDD